MSDYISNLPDNLIEQILVLLTLKEAARTSVLSKKWRYKWTTIPHLVFDSSTFRSLEHSNEFPRFIHQVLSHHEGSLSKFMLAFPRLRSFPEIDHLISLLRIKNIEEFTLWIQDGNPHKIPSDLFSCLQLKFLCLQKCVLEPPPDFSGFARLTSINLIEVNFPAGSLETFVAKCPLLECLTVYECTNLDRISFDAPNLKILDYIGYFDSINFKNTPRLKNVSLDTSHNYIPVPSVHQHPWRRISCLRTLSSLPSLEYLHLRQRFFRIMALGLMPARVGIRFNSLVTLVLTRVHFDGRAAMSVICLLNSAPKLEKLHIQFCQYMANDQPVAIKIFSKVLDSEEYFLRSLRVVELSYLKGFTGEMALIKVLLAKSLVLEKLHIYQFYKVGCSAAQTLSVVKKINQWRRRSPLAEVFFY